MIGHRVALAFALILLAAPAAAQGSGSTATALDPKTALRDSQAAIGRDMSQHRLLDAQVAAPCSYSDCAGTAFFSS